MQVMSWLEIWGRHSQEQKFSALATSKRICISFVSKKRKWETVLNILTPLPPPSRLFFAEANISLKVNKSARSNILLSVKSWHQWFKSVLTRPKVELNSNLCRCLNVCACEDTEKTHTVCAEKDKTTSYS